MKSGKSVGRKVSAASVAILIALSTAHLTVQGSRHFEVRRIHALRPDEGVFAYARIAPDGRRLAYAAEAKAGAPSEGQTATIKVINLESHDVEFTSPGVDAYWSTDGTRIIFLAQDSIAASVSIWEKWSGQVSSDVAPVGLGDYFSWARRGNRDLILTIDGNYYYLDGDRGVLPAASIDPCPGVGVGERPLISKDGHRVSVFVRGELVIRNLTDCRDVFRTGVVGAKADFSWDGRYVAFHAPRTNQAGYKIQVIDLKEKTLRNVDEPKASCLFPSWTMDGRLAYRCDGADFRGFVMASNVLAVPATSLLPRSIRTRPLVRWANLFPMTETPKQDVVLVTVWAPWTAHAPAALRALQRLADEFSHLKDLAIFTAAEPSSHQRDLERLRLDNSIRLPILDMSQTGLTMTEAVNQMPTTFLFRDGVLSDSRLGAQSYESLVAWVKQLLAARPFPSITQH